MKAVLGLGCVVCLTAAPVNAGSVEYDFSGKTIILFATSGGSGLGRIAAELAPSCPGAKLVAGGLLNGNPPEASLKQWAQSL